MAYLIELEDDNAESDIPTTVLRSKADCPGSEAQATLSTNDIVINKLTQILSYLRQGGKHGKKLKKTKEKEAMPPPQAIPGLKVNKPVQPLADDSIYGNIGAYNPAAEKPSRDSKDRRSDKRDYFDDKTRKAFVNPDEEKSSKTKDSKSDAVLEAERTLGALLKPGGAEEIAKVISFFLFRQGRWIDCAFFFQKRGDKKTDKILSKLSAEPEGYAECYPGFEEMNDALEDSDDEADYSKMDLVIENLVCLNCFMKFLK